MKSTNIGTGQMLADILSAYRFHFLFWGVYIVYESLIIGFMSGIWGRLENYLVHYALNISLFYLHLYMMERTGSLRKKTGWLGICLLSLAEILAYFPVLALLNQLFTDYNRPMPENPLGLTRLWTFAAVYRALFFILISTGYWAFRRFVREREISRQLERDALNERIEREVIEKSLVRAQNDYLRAQVSPHFIYNTLAFVYRRIRKTDSRAGEVVLTLADILRYATDTGHYGEFVPLAREVEQVRLLIGLFELKEKSQVCISFTYDHNSPDQMIVPLALLTLVENVFKHGEYQNPGHPARISIRTDGGMLRIRTENLPGRMAPATGTGTGLRNLKERLSISYGPGARLEWKSGAYFTVDLQICL